MSQPLSKLSSARIADALGSNIYIVSGILRLAQELDPTDTGCYIVVWRWVNFNEPHWAPAVGFAVGDVPTEKFVKYVHFAHEKAHRLSAHPPHITSFESADESDPANPRYPGAVRMDKDSIIISCSGLVWKFDELVCLAAGFVVGLASPERLREVIARSRNEHALKHFTQAGILSA